jgi:hypothetical protein
MKWMFLHTFSGKCCDMISEKTVFSIFLKTCSEQCLSKLMKIGELENASIIDPNKLS